MADPCVARCAVIRGGRGFRRRLDRLSEEHMELARETPQANVIREWEHGRLRIGEKWFEDWNDLDKLLKTPSSPLNRYEKDFVIN